MTRNTMGIIKGVGGGLAAGMAVGFIGGQMMKNSKQMKKKAGKAMHAVGDLFDTCSICLNKALFDVQMYKNSGDFPISFSCGKWPLFFCVEKGYKVFSEW